MKRQLNIKLLALILGAVFMFILLFAFNTKTAYAAPPHSFGLGLGRYGRVVENDYHTAEWERFFFNYHFVSGMNYRYDLGRPTSWDGFVPIDVLTVNFRSDAMVSLRPPAYGIFSGNFQTLPANMFFQQPANPNFHQPSNWGSQTINPVFDTINTGVNAPAGNQNSHSAPNDGFLPPTSIS